MTDHDPEALPATVGLLLWRHSPGGREVCTLELDGRTVLPKGVLHEGEDERAAATRLAHDLCDAAVEDEEPLAAPPGGGGTVAWWGLRWAGPARIELPGRRVAIRWLDSEEAPVLLARLAERQLVQVQPSATWRRALAWLDRPRRAHELRARWQLIDDRARALALPDAPGPDGRSARVRALTLLQRAVDADAVGDLDAAREVRAELQRLEARARPQAAADLAEYDRVTRLAEDARALREERKALGVLLAVALSAVVLLGHAGWYSAGPAPADLHLALTIFGLIGGACSALTARSAFPHLLRPILGSVAANLLHAVLSGSSLVQLSPAGWVLAAYAAGFAERWVSRPTRSPSAPQNRAPA